MPDDWKWYGEDANSSIVIQAVQAIAAYTNPHGDIVIRQENSMQDEDSVVVVPRSHIKVLVKALRAELAIKHTPDE